MDIQIPYTTLFRSTGSYEPDQFFLHRPVDRFRSFDPQALSSLTWMTWQEFTAFMMFRSTGSYEPDPNDHPDDKRYGWIDPQALTRPDRDARKEFKKTLKVSIHRLSYEPDLEIFNYIMAELQVSIHRLLRA